MNAPDVPDFGPTEESISWAKSDLSDLQSGLIEFFTKDNVSVIAEKNNETGHVTFKMKISGAAPFAKFKRHAVDALLHTRNSFDQATNTAGTFLTRKRFSRNFPWSQSPDDLNFHRLKKFPKQLWDPIKSQMPYPTGDTHTGGNDLIRALARLSNNKHSVGFQVDAVGGLLHAGAVEFVGNGYLQEFHAWAPNWDPVKQEALLFAIKSEGIGKSEGVGVKLHENSTLAFTVCLDIPEISNPPDVMSALNEFITAAERNLELMKAVCGKQNVTHKSRPCSGMAR